MSQAAKIGIVTFALGAGVGGGLLVLFGGSEQPAGVTPGPAAPAQLLPQQQQRSAVVLDASPARTAPGATASNAPAERSREATADEPGVALAVEVILPDGSQATEAKVAFQQAKDEIVHTWTPGKPNLPVAPGLYTVRASAPDGLTRSSTQVLTVREDETPAALTLQLEVRRGLLGRVDAPSDETGDTLHVWALRLEPGARDVDALRLHKSGKRKQVEDDLSFRFLDLPAGTYAVGVGRSKRAVEATVLVELGQDSANVDLTLPRLDRSRVVVVHALGPDGQPLADVEAHGAYRTQDGGKGKARGEATRKTDGSLWLVPDEGLLAVLRGETEGEAYVRVSSSQYGERAVSLPSGASMELTVRFEEASVLTLSVDGFVGSEFEGDLKAELIRVEADDYAQKKGKGGKKQIDANGEETFGPVQPGDYELRLLVRADGKDRLASTTPLRLASGENRFSVATPQLASVTVRLEQAGEDASLGLHRVGGGKSTRRKEKPDENGLVVFDRLVPGDYQVVLWDGGDASFMQVSVQAATQVTFQGTVADALRVNVSDPQGSLAQLGLRSGDHLVGLDGTAFEGTFQIQSLLREAAEGPHTLTVLRGGGQFELSVPDLEQVLKPKRLNSLKKLLDPSKGQGGWFEPVKTPGR